jgi:hypothetical protein
MDKERQGSMRGPREPRREKGARMVSCWPTSVLVHILQSRVSVAQVVITTSPGGSFEEAEADGCSQGPAVRIRDGCTECSTLRRVPGRANINLDALNLQDDPSRARRRSTTESNNEQGNG